MHSIKRNIVTITRDPFTLLIEDFFGKSDFKEIEYLHKVATIFFYCNILLTRWFWHKIVRKKG